MMLIFYGLGSCDTCRKAEKTLRSKGLALTKVDVRADGIPRDVLRRFLDQFGEELLNKRSTTWRNLGQIDREIDSLELLMRHPTLMKRPVIDADGRLFLGWSADVQSELLAD